MGPAAFRVAACALAILCTAEGAYACSCVTSDPKTSFKQADLVFVADVVAYDGTVARLRPDEVFKGRHEQTIEIVTRPDGVACGYGERLTPGSRHLLYAYRHEYMPYLEVSSCSRSKPVERAACDLSYLRGRAWWWRSRLSSLRLFDWLGIRWAPCEG